MTDIVERLRARPLHVPTAARDMDEAADEIERLREVLQLRTEAYDAIMAAISKRTLGEAMDVVALRAIRAKSQQMAEDDGLWFRAETAAEAYVQQELRKLCAVIEGEE
jgi:hypothetical protein